MLRPYEPLLSVVPEGWGLVGSLGVGAVLLSASGAVLPSVALLAALPAAAGYCADRAHAVHSKPRGILAPLDGTVIHRRECHDAVLGREAIRLTFRPSMWGGYCLRAPLTGHVLNVQGSGAGISRLRSDDGDEVLLVARGGGLLGARPVMVPVGDRVGQGRRCGLRRLITELDLLIPAGARVEVGLGSRVRSGQTVLATLLRKT